MSIQTEINRLQNAKANLKSVLQENGVTVPSSATLDEYPNLFSTEFQSGSTYLYKATFFVDAWVQSGEGYKQVASATALAGSPRNPKYNIMASCLYIEDTYPDSTLESMEQSLSVLNRAQKVLQSSWDYVGAFLQLSCITRAGEKPESDIEVYFLAK